jgi:hypothetical protein
MVINNAFTGRSLYFKSQKERNILNNLLTIQGIEEIQEAL